MKKVMINKCYGGFCFSKKAIQLYIERKQLDVKPYLWDHSEEESKPVLLTWEAYQTQFQDSWHTCLLHDNGNYFSQNEKIERDDKVMVSVVEELGAEANGQHAEIRMAEIMDNEEYEIHDYDGVESLIVGFGLRHI